MTSTIAPHRDATSLAHVDPEQRLAEYRTALDFYLDEVGRGTVDHLVYADNSGYPLQMLAERADARGLADRTSFISLPPVKEAVGHRFFLELGLLSAAFDQPPLSGIEPDDQIWKVTGRYLIKNLGALVRSAPSGTDLYVNSRDHPYGWTDFYIAAFTRRGFDAVFRGDRGRYAATSQGERALRARIADWSDPAIRIDPRMRCVPQVSGVRGLDGRRYDDRRNRFKYRMRVIANRLAPRLWI